MNSAGVTRIKQAAAGAAILMAALACNLPGQGGTPTPVPTAPRPIIDASQLPPTAPKVLAQRPLRGEELLLDGSIDIYFDQPMNKQSVENALLLQNVSYTVTWIDDATLRITPESGQISRAQTYNLSIGTEAQSADGLNLDDPISLDIESVGFLRVADAYPQGEAAQPGSSITVLFNRPVVTLGGDQAPLPLEISPQVAGEGEWISTSIYQFTPEAPLAGGQTYTLSVPAGLQAQDTAVLEQPYIWSFTTALPEVTAVTPAEDTFDVGLDQPVVITFNQPMDQLSVQAVFSLSDQDGRTIEGTFAWSEDGAEMTFTPAGGLAYGANYTASLASSASGLGGVSALQGDIDWSFSTVLIPAVSSTNPFDGEGNWGVFGLVEVYFTAPMDETTLTEERIVIKPVPPNDVSIFYNSFGQALNISTYFEPDTTYTITLLPGAADPYGRRIEEPYTFTFTTGSLEPAIQLNTQGVYGLYDASRDTELFLLHRNVSSINFELYELSLVDFANLTNVYTYEDLTTALPANTLIREWSQATEQERNETFYLRVPMVEGGGSLPPGIYALLVTSPDAAASWHFMIVSDLHLTYKQGFDEVFAWLTDLQTGQPVNGAQVTIYDARLNEIGSGTTGADGILQAPIPSRETIYDRTYAVVESGGSFSLVMNDWDTDIQPYQFNLPLAYSPSDYALYIYTDRPIYRPGQQMFFKGVLRSKDDVTYALPSQATIEIEIFNNSGEAIYSEALPVNELGTFAGDIVLAEDAELGPYFIQATLGEFTVQQYFDVAAYRPPQFSVDVIPQQASVVAGEEIVIDAEARFFFGEPVRDAELTYSVFASEYFFDAYDGPGRYSFTDFDVRAFSTDYFPGAGELLTSGEGTTNAEGRFQLTLPAETDPIGGSVRLLVEVGLTDESGFPVFEQEPVIIHQSEIYIGLQPDTYVSQADQPQVINLISVNTDGEPVPNQAIEVELVDQEWNSIQEVNEFGETVYTYSVEETRIGEVQRVTTDEDGLAQVSVTPPGGGNFLVRATSQDEAGRETASAVTLWVTGGGFIPWRQPNNNRFDLVPDQEVYAPGDTAEVLIASPLPGGDVQALITLERGGVLSYEIIDLPSNSYVYEIPVDASLAPNVFISVLLMQPAQEPGGVPAFKYGMAEIAVTPTEQTLSVTLTPDREEVGPGEQVTYTVSTTDFEGQPVDAEVSLALVDLAVLQLAPNNTLPIVDYFYSQQPLGVRTALPITLLVDALNQELFDLGKGGGGGGGGGFFEVRDEFRDTAFWQARLRTGTDGTEQVIITLPDNLATWRMDARAVTAETQVGQAEVDIITTKPLLVRPVTPRFLVAGDEVTLSAVINNNTDERIQVEAVLKAGSVTLIGDEMQRVTIPANGQVEVSWPATVDADARAVNLVFSVEGGGYSDAARPTQGNANLGRALPVYRYEVPETVRAAGQMLEAGTRVEGIALPPTYEVTQGEVVVRVDPSLAAASLDALDWLSTRPYDHTEIVVSRLLPNAQTLSALREFGLADAELEAKLERSISQGLQALYARQNTDGGWGWSPNSNDVSDLLMSAYAVQGLLAAQEAGYTLDQIVLERGVAYLQGRQASLDVLNAESALNREAYIAYVLALAGQPDAASTSNLFEVRTSLALYGRAYLAQALWLANPSDPRLAELESDLVNAALLSASGAHWEEDRCDCINWNSDTRSTAIILDAFVTIWPENNLIPNIARWLMVARLADHWETTQETAWSVIALTKYLRTTGELEGDYTWQVSFNGQPLASGEAGPQTIREAAEIELGIDALTAVDDGVSRVQFERSDGPGRMYYTTDLTAYLPAASAEALGSGIIVARQYLNENGTRVTQGSVGEVITVVLNITVPNDRNFVLVEDYYPAGAEPIDPDLLTESVLNEGPVLRLTQDEEGRPVQGWGGWWFSDTDLRDERAVLLAEFLPAGSYQYTYQIRLGTPGRFQVIPSTARELYFPDVYGRGEGAEFTILP